MWLSIIFAMLQIKKLRFSLIQGYSTSKIQGWHSNLDRGTEGTNNES